MLKRLKSYARWFGYAGALALLVGLSFYAVQRQFTLWAEVVLALGVILIGVFILLVPGEIRRLLTGRPAVYGSNALVAALAFLAIVSLINFISSRHHHRFDLTESKQYSLSPQTIKILHNLDKPVKVYAFFTPADPRRTEVEDRLKEYTYHTDKISYEFVDPDLKPALARQYEVTSYGTLVFVRGDKTQKTYGIDEQDITSAILKVSRDEVKAVYFTTGHQERDPKGYTRDGYSQIASALEKDNYKVETLNLAAITDTLPTDMAVMVIAGPKREFLPEEVERVFDYLNQGGKVMLLLDPAQPDPFGEKLAEWGVRFRNDLVVDPVQAFFGDVVSPLITKYRYHEITKDMGGLTTLFPLVRSIEVASSHPEGVSIAKLVRTSAQSWGETKWESQHVTFNEGEDVKGPLDIAVAVEKKIKGEGKEEKVARLILIGDSDFVSNGILNSIRGAFGNADLFLNAINWLAEEEALISIRPKPPQERPLLLTAPQRRFVMYSSLGLLPLAVLIAGGLMWWSRR